ncbi:MAG TPA: efflux RND transporter periplasmic adaptor subunit, partial [Allocoleopsis sp.]
VLGLGLGATIATVATHFTPGSSPSVSNGSPTAIAPTQSVTIATAKITPVTQTINVTGTVAAFDMLPILAEVSGLQIQQVLVDEGDSVEAGQVLAVLNSSVLQAQLNQARADVASAQAVVQQKQATLAQTQATQAQAESDLRRYQNLAESGAISRRDLDSYTTAAKTAAEAVHVAEADIASAKADVQSRIAHTQELETQIAQTVVRAPASGIIAERVARVGNVTGTDKLFALIRENALESQAKVPESELAKIIPGAQVRITSDADSRIQVQGQVRDIAPLVDANTRQATVKIDLPADPLLRSGMFLKAAIAIQTTPALTIPAAAVIPQSEGQAIVYVLQDTTVRATPVTTGTHQAATNTTPAQIVITRGLQADDRVVVEGAGYLKDGDRVTVVQP